MMALIAFPAIAFAQAGSLDASFGGDGKVTTDFSSKIDVGWSLAIQPDGKIIVVGETNIGEALTRDFAIARYNTDGSPDASFGSGGKLTTNFGGLANDYAYSVTLMDDGKILAAGSTMLSGYRFGLVRYMSDGSFDNTFGTGGFVQTDFGGMEDLARNVMIDPTGKIVATGFRNDGLKRNFALIRFNYDGSLDPTFGDGGKVYTSFATNRHDQSYSSGIQIDGKIVLAGYSYVGTSSDFQFALARYNTDGTLDNTFGTGGMVLTDVALVNGQGYSMQIQHDQKIVVAGYSFVGDDVDFTLIRYNNDGTLDNTFGTGGIVRTDFGAGKEDYAYALTIQNDGKFVVAGNSYHGTTFDIAVARYNTDGSLDNTFGSGGLVTTDGSGSADGAFCVKTQNDGKIVLCGYSYSGSSNDFIVVRYNGDNTTGVAENSDQKILQVSPNPFDNSFNINCNESGDIRLFDLLGNEILFQNITAGTTSVSTEHLSDGIYFLQYHHGDHTENIKLVKK